MKSVGINWGGFKTEILYEWGAWEFYGGVCSDNFYEWGSVGILQGALKELNFMNGGAGPSVGKLLRGRFL